MYLNLESHVAKELMKVKLEKRTLMLSVSWGTESSTEVWLRRIRKPLKPGFQQIPNPCDFGAARCVDIII
jgi:hypothetical protein